MAFTKRQLKQFCDDHGFGRQISMDEKVIVILKRNEEDKGIDIEIPLNISANELIYGLNMGLGIGLNMNNLANYYLRSENPIALLRGEKTLEEHGIRNGSIIYLS